MIWQFRWRKTFTQGSLALLLAANPVLAQAACWDTGSAPKPNSLYVVQPAAPTGDGTVLDTLTNLMWKQCDEGRGAADCLSTPEGGLPGLFIYFTLDEAFAVALASSYAGYHDWRLPTLTELQSLLPSDCISSLPTINGAVFPNKHPDAIWTSSTAGSVVGAWTVYFGNGTAHYNARSFGNELRLVRTNVPVDTSTPVAQLLTFAAPPTLALGSTAVVSATSSAPHSGNAITYASSTPAVCSINAGSGLVTLAVGVQAGDTCIITANQLGGVGNGKTYTPAVQAVQNVVVGKIAQSLTFGAAPSATVGGSGPLAATSNRGLVPVGFSSASPGICTVSGVNGSTVTGVSTGICSITATQAGDATTYLSALANQSFSVGVAPVSCNLHMDGTNALLAQKEGVILLRAMLGFTGTAVTDGTGIATPWATLRDQLNAYCGTSFQ